MKPALAIALSVPFAALSAVAAPAGAQTWSSPSSYSQPYGGNYGPGGYGQDCGHSCGGYRQGDGRRYVSRPYDFNGQADVPGDYRCDAYWDRGRTDCDARWRDQRPTWRRTSHRSGRYESHGYGHGGAAVYPGAYGRPDVVYSSRYGDSGYRDYGRDPQRIGWCRAEYRSYDPGSGYYTAYSGQRIFCG